MLVQVCDTESEPAQTGAQRGNLEAGLAGYKKHSTRNARSRVRNGVVGKHVEYPVPAPGATYSGVSLIDMYLPSDGAGDTSPPK